MSGWVATLSEVDGLNDSPDPDASHSFRALCGCAACMGKTTAPDVSQNTIPGDSSTTETLTLGVSRTSAIDFAGDTDWFRVTLTAGQTYNFSLDATAGSSLDPLLNLRDSAGNIVASNDDSGSSLNSLIANFTATTGGVYYVDARAFDTSTGGYSVRASAVNTGSDTILASTATTSTITVNGANQSSTIDFGGDADWFRVELVAGQNYVFTLNGTGGTPLADPYLELRSSTGQLLAIDDDGGLLGAPNTDSRLLWSATESGTFYVSARAFDAATTGSGYTLSATTGAPQNPLDTLELGLTVSQQNISVYFSFANETFSGKTSSRDWTTAEKASAMAALATFAAVTGLTFTETSSSAGARFILQLTDLDANVLGQFGTTGGVGYGQFSPTASGWTTAGLTPGGLGFVTLIHEFGHGLGLAHPHEDGQDVQIMQGVIDPFGSYGTFSLNQGVFTTMTYNDGWPGGPDGGAPSNNYGSQMTPMALDIALLQQKYGVNATYNNGANTYVLPDFNGGGTGYGGIWDTGGVDQITYGGTRNATIDLRPATLLNQVGGGGYVSFASGIFGGFTIAANVVIENATGGSGNDSITGNGVANSLNGGTGADTLTGGGGDDILVGGEGIDSMLGGAGADSYGVDSLSDIVTENANEGFDTVYASVNYTLGANVEGLGLQGSAASGIGNALANSLVGNALANYLGGEAGDDVLNGGAENDILDGGAGNDILFGGVGSDSYAVDTSGDAIGENANEGFDAVYSTGDYTLGANLEALYLQGSALNGFGNAAANALYGNGLANYLRGNEGDDYLEGRVGDDILEGSSGNDILVGGAGSDSYGVDASGDQIGENANEGFDAVYSTGDYTLGANLEALYLLGSALNGFGNSAANALYGNALANYLRGNEGDDYLEGGADNDILEGSSGNDIMVGGTGSDSYGVDSTGDQIGENANEGFDSVYATSSYTLGANLEGLYLTGAGAEGYGNSLANAIFGNGLDNNLNGFAGNDVLNGGAGNDTFVFNPGTGQDVISDFVAGGTEDRINLSAYAGTGITYTVTQQGANTVFSFSNGDAITLQNVTATNLVQSGDYWF